jgi:hypothetical protein
MHQIWEKQYKTKFVNAVQDKCLMKLEMQTRKKSSLNYLKNATVLLEMGISQIRAVTHKEGNNCNRHTNNNWNIM